MVVDVDRIQYAQDHGLTAGVVSSDGTIRTRKEIDEFIRDTDCFNLYLLALIDLQRTARWEDAFGYFQIAGIHGKPFSPWDEVTPDRIGRRRDAELGPDGMPVHGTNYQAGYCSHSSNLFPTWHRAYLAMFEQALYLQMVSVAGAFPERLIKKYLEAADRFGLPYWDPFLPRRKLTNKWGYQITKCGIPVIMETTEVRIRTPHEPDRLQNVANPLYSYRFAPDKANWETEAGFSFQNMFEDVIKMPTMALNTIRGPSYMGKTSHQYVNNTLTNAVSPGTGPAIPLGAKIYRILNGPNLTYTQMSNSAYISNDDKERPLNHENSLEGFHNDVHTLCGNGGDGRSGHMGLTEFAAFDPIFWLHHTNVDRICSIWQALNPHTWDWNQPLLADPTYVTALNDPETPETHLIPFRKERYEDGTVIWWNSNDLRECRSLGYTYPELKKAGSNWQSLRQWVTDTYEWTTVSGEPPEWKTLFEITDFHKIEAFPEVVRIDGTGEPVEKVEDAEEEPKSSGGLSKWFHFGGNSTHHDRYKHIRPLMKGQNLIHWNVTIKVHKFALNGSFQIFVFLGDFSDDPRAWPHERHLVGIDGIFANRHLEACENCRHQQNRGLIDSDVISLTTSLISYWKNEEEHCGMKLKSLESGEVLKFLKYNLHWRVLDSAGRQHDPRGIESLHVDIGSQVVRLPQEYGAQPIYEDEYIHHNITNGE